MILGGNEDGLLCSFLTADATQLRLQHRQNGEQRLLDLRVWRLANGRWEAGEGLMLPLEQLPNLWEALATATNLLLDAAHPDAIEASAHQRRLLHLTREVERARERLASTRPEDYRRLRDYRRVRTLRVLALRRAERLVLAAEQESSSPPEP